MSKLYNVLNAFAMIFSVIATISIASFFFGGEWKTWEEVKANNKNSTIAEDELETIRTQLGKLKKKFPNIRRTDTPLFLAERYC